MKKLFSLVVVLFAALILVSCGGGAKTYEIALVTDVGNIDDKSFNEGAWNGVKEYAEAEGKTYQYYRPAEDTTDARVETMKTAIEKGAKVVVCPGYLFEEAIYAVQNDYPEVAFLILDGEPHDADYNYHTASNVHCILYQEEQAGYFAGYAAVKEGYRSLGFLGGMAVPAVVRFGYGFVQGAEAAAAELGLADGSIAMEFAYTGGFAPSPEIKTQMDGWYAGGTEVVFACGGGIYLSVTAAAEEAGKKVIGVDVDQAGESATIITSAEKKLTQSVKLALASFYAAGMKWDAAHAGKTAKLGAADECVGLPTAEASWRLENYTVAEYQELFAQVKAGTVVVSADIDNHPATTKVTVNWPAAE